MSTKTYPYDPDLPYVVEREGDLVARFAEPDAAAHFASQRWTHEVIDTTPAPRLPEDAKFVTWKLASGATRVSRAARGLVQHDGGWVKPEGLPGVTGETVFTVLEERKS